MNKIDEMIRELCPEGVKKVKLGEVGSFYNGVTGKTKEDFVGGNAKFITYMNVFSNPKLRLDIDDKIRISEGEKQNLVCYGDVLFTTSSETKDECGMSSVLTQKTTDKLYLNSFSFGYRFNDISSVVPSYCSYMFRSAKIRAKISKTANGVTRYNISKKLFEKLEIPLPPLPIQHEIVSVLDSFSRLQSKLEEELAVRQKQMEFYREKLLTFDENDSSVKWMKLGEVGTFKYGYTDKALDCGDARYIRITDISDDGKLNMCNAKYIIMNEEAKAYLLTKDDLLVARTGATFGKTLLFNSDVKSVYASFLIKINLDNSINHSFYWHYTKSKQYWKQANKLVGGGAQPQFNANVLSLIEVPVPPLSRQQEIVSTLDTMSSLIDKLKEEIELRKKQYEYYREALLSF